VEHSEEKDGKKVVAILRFQGGSPRLCRLSTTPVRPRWTSLIYIDRMSGFMGTGKLSIPVTTLSNCTSLLQGGLLEGK
jgi:hypothetical protein